MLDDNVTWNRDYITRLILILAQSAVPDISP
jgi:hypothetical protein